MSFIPKLLVLPAALALPIAASTFTVDPPTTQVCYQWEAATGAVAQYEIQPRKHYIAWINTDFPTILTGSAEPSGCIELGTDAPYGAQVSVRVRAVDDGGCVGEWSWGSDAHRWDVRKMIENHETTE